MSALIRRGVNAVLAVPLYWKILLANGALALGAVILGAAMHAPGSVAVLAMAGALLSLLVNGALLRLALAPLDGLQRAAGLVQEGDLDARAPESPLADPAFRRLSRTFNAALDALASSRRSVRLLLARSMEADEAERRRVAHALENDVAQRLAGLLMRVRRVERSNGKGDIAPLLEESAIEITRAADIVRGYAGGRRPAVLEELGLLAALRAEAYRLREDTGLDVRIAGDEPRGLGSDARMALYRVLCEALGNVARHSGGSARVRVSNGGGRVVASVEDDGRGFDPGSADDGAGVGLAAMRERAESLGGRFFLWSAPGKGTRVRVELPV